MNELLKAKSPVDSEVKMTQLVLPSDTNVLGTIFGGTLMSWMDIAAAITATRHARSSVVTASVDALNFLAPIKLGYIVTIESRVVSVGRSSMEIKVNIHSENPKTGVQKQTVSAYMTFVAVDDSGKSIAVPPLQLETAEEIAEQEKAIARRKIRASYQS